MKRKFLIGALLCLVAWGAVFADGKLSSNTYAFLKALQTEDSIAALPESERATRNVKSVRGRSVKAKQRRAANRMTKVKMIGGERYVQALVNTESWTVAPIAELEAMGVKVNGQFGNILTVTAPVNKLEAMSQVKNIRQVAVARNVRLANDRQRSSSNVDDVIAGNGLQKPYTGKDVVVGVIDTGIDFNHLAFKDANGNTRVKRVYMPDGEGNAPKINGEELPGAEYVTPAEIAALTTDNKDESHGTHTSATAAGTQVGNYGGMAPDADIVLCGLGEELTDANILNSINYIFDYAKSVGKPAVVNLSLGDHVGPHDGSSDFCKSLNSLVDNGRILVLAAGNEGDYNVHFATVFANAGTNVEQKAVLLKDTYFAGGLYQDSFDLYANNGKAFYIQYIVVDAKGKQLAVSKKQSALLNGTTFNMSTHSTFKNYYDGTATTYSTVDANSGKYNVYIDIDCESTGANKDWYLGILLWGDQGGVIHGWNVGGLTEFSNCGFSKYINGDSEVSISGMATGDKTISVGAFVTREQYKALNGGTYTATGFKENDIAPFSSYGPDRSGVARPEILAAGGIVLSAVNGYDDSTVGDKGSVVATATDKSGKTHYWGPMAGTSMAAPEVTGIIAEWLQANPNLNSDDIKDVFKNTAVRDDVVTSNAKKSGAGKIDALAGIKYIASSGIEDIKTDEANVVVYPNPSDGNFSVYVPGEEKVEMCIYSANGALVYRQMLQADNDFVKVSLAGKLSTGVYVVAVSGGKVHSSSRLLVK